MANIWIIIASHFVAVYGANIFTYNPRYPNKNIEKCMSQGFKFSCFIKSEHVTYRRCVDEQKDCVPLWQKYCAGEDYFVKCKSKGRWYCGCQCWWMQ
ncbi:uncharacterized protein LOC142590575 isoform X3 [Dermacentor variabilis]|uniref:uncharacterized protein LOC142590575 isoform X3 n=1 Tax=Dermacentor variabilis TaxID=34621 RepID=UPI003F5C094C